MAGVLVTYVYRSRNGGKFGRYRVYKTRSAAARSIKALRKSKKLVRVVSTRPV